MPRRAVLQALSTFVSVVALGLVVWAGPASASEVYNLDPNPASNGNVVVNGAGDAFIAWTHEDSSSIEQPTFCRILAGTGGCTSPATLPVPDPGADSLDSASAAFPVLGAGETVFVVAPRYVDNDVVVYKSIDNGASFGKGVIHEKAYSNKSDPTNVLPYESDFLVGAFNSGIGFSSLPSTAGNGANFGELATNGLVGSSYIGLDASFKPVLVYWTLTEPYSVRLYRFVGPGVFANEGGWSGPTEVTHGYETKLSSGPGGLFLVSADQAGNETPSILNVRKYTGSSFGPPVTLATDGAPGLFDGGAIAQSPNGARLAVAWPAMRGGDGRQVMRLFTSTNGGASFTSTEIADLSAGYSLGDNAQLALDNGTGGWLTFLNSSGLRLADFYPIAGGPPPVGPGGGTKPADYKGKTKVADSKSAGDFDLTLTLPKSCVQSQQRFFAGVGKRKRHGLAKTLGGKIKFKSVVFVYDGKKLTVKKKKPFRYLIDPGTLAPGSTHLVKTKVTAILTKGGRETKIKRTLQGTIKAC